MRHLLAKAFTYPIPRLALAALSFATLAAGSLSSVPAFADEQPPAAQAFVVQPEADQPTEEIGSGYFRLSLSPGDVRDLHLVVKNTGAEPITLHIDPVDGVQVAGGGVDYSTREKALTGVGTWLQVTPERLTLAPGEAQRITAQVQLPATLAPGEYVGGVAVENEQIQSQGTGGNVLIDVHYRQVNAVVISVPGPQTPALEIGAVTLTPAGKGSLATLDLRNAGNVLLKGKGTIAIGGGAAQSGALPITVDTLLPTSAAQVKVSLPNLTLQPGAYDVRVQLEAEKYGPLATWQGSVPVADPRQAEASSAQEMILQPAQPLAAAVQELPTPLLWGAAGLLILLMVGLGSAVRVFIGRRLGAGRRAEHSLAD